MKKQVKLIILLLILFLVFEFILFIFKDNHEEEYTIENKNYTYKVKEIYKDDKYYLKIKNKKNIYSFEVENNFHKKKKIIEKIYTNQGKEFTCIYPVLKKDTSSSNIICSKNKKTYFYTYYKNDLTNFVNNLKEKGYSSPSWEEDSNKEKKIETLITYPDSLRENTYIYIYKYDGFFTINSKNLEKLNLFDNDTYVNHLGTNVDKYYVIPNYNEKYDYSELFRINMTNNKVKTIKLKDEISKDSYINGILDDEIYIFDKDKLVQYSINPKKKKVKEVGNKKDGVIYYDLEYKTSDVYTFRDEEVKFKRVDNYIEKLENKEITHIEKNDNSYYYQIDNNVYYYNGINKNKVLLFNMEISDFKLINNTLYFISKDSLYSYDFIYGLDKILTYSELSFNSENRLAIYME